MLALSTQGFLFVQASWSVNQDWIAEALCANPETDCDGHCVLMERMEGQHDHDGEPDTAMLATALSIRPILTAAPRLAPPPVAEGFFVPGRSVGPASGAPGDVFRPPRETDPSAPRLA